MTEINEKLIRKVAELARLNLTDKEVKQFVPQLKEVLDNFSIIDKADTKGVEPSFQPLSIPVNLRDDNPQKGLTNDEALANTQHKKDGFFKGPAPL